MDYNEVVSFHVVSRFGPRPGVAAPLVILRRNNWDDYSYRTTFDFTFVGIDGFEITGLEVKILNRFSNDSDLPDDFDHLNSEYCSLGQNLDYYAQLANLHPGTYRQILIGLRDVVYDDAILQEFQELEGFKKSLIRFSEAEKALREASSFFPELTQPPAEESYRFHFSSRVSGASAAHELDFDFSEVIPGLHRIMVFIGRNGSGKTQVLSNLAASLSGWRVDAGQFSPQRPPFSKVLALSYSPFDKFDVPDEDDNSYSYKYCGIRTSDGLLSLSRIQSDLISAYADVNENGRIQSWREAIEHLIGRDADPNSILLDSRLDELSSGETLLVMLMTQLIANIETNSMILFDEPETHLHPEALSAVIRVLHSLLSDYSSFAVIATHSPIVLQEIPARSVRVFRRIGNYPVVDVLPIESFGENLTTISNEVFESSETRHSFRTHLRSLLQHHSIDEISSLFN